MLDDGNRDLPQNGGISQAMKKHISEDDTDIRPKTVHFASTSENEEERTKTL